MFLYKYFSVNPCPAELFGDNCHSFEAGAISSFKWQKIFITLKNKHLRKWSSLPNQQLQQDI